MVHKHSVRDVGARFLIDQFTRQIKNDSANKTTIVQYDHNSERLTFEIPLYVDGHAMTLCDLIEIHYINISTDGKSQNHGMYEVKDIKAEGEKAVFTWLISQEATQLAGSLNFFIVFKCTENGVTVYRWGTEIYKNLAISAGMDNGEAVLTQYPDILAQWKAQLFDASNTAVSNVATAEASALAAIEAAGEAKKQSVLDSIPDEYEALSELANQNHKTKAAAIVVNVEGESIAIKDASEYPLQNLKLFGKSTQDGTPTPDAPVDIVSVENPVVTVSKKNLIPFPYKDTTTTKNGVTFTVNNDGSIHLKGTAEKATNFSVFSGSFPLSGTFTLSGVNNDTTPSTHYMQPYVDDVFQSSQTNGSQTYEINGNLTAISLYVKDGETVDCVVRPQLEIGSVATEYEAPTMLQTIETSHTLPGIPVSSGGNYTDENGQQWICDEVDLARGVYVQRVASITLDGSESWGVSDNEFYCSVSAYSTSDGESVQCICTHYPAESRYEISRNTSTVGYTGISIRDNYIRLVDNANCNGDIDALKMLLAEQASTGNFVEIQYIIATPIETPLSEAEINAFKALHSNKPVTTILNDSGACMAVEYVADTKTYIDNKITKMMEGVTA